MSWRNRSMALASRKEVFLMLRLGFIPTTALAESKMQGVVVAAATYGFSGRSERRNPLFHLGLPGESIQSDPRRSSETAG